MTTRAPKYVPCPECDGIGKSTANYDGDTNIEALEDCKACKGDGDVLNIKYSVTADQAAAEASVTIKVDRNYDYPTNQNLDATFQNILDKMDPEVHPGIKRAIVSTGATHVALYECHMMDSSHLGERFALCVGPTCTYTTPEKLPRYMSRRGLASDTSSLVLVAPVDSL
jgi:hypothetical protein